MRLLPELLKKPIKLKQVALALHKFSDEGMLWIDLLSDQKGKPGKVMTTSDLLPSKKMKFTPGYTWVNFDLSKSEQILSPGRYWIALGFTGSPIVNWFFSYGKPVGPQDGTRYKTIFDSDWSASLAFEFNYRVKGLTNN